MFPTIHVYDLVSCVPVISMIFVYKTQYDGLTEDIILVHCVSCLVAAEDDKILYVLI